MYGTFYEVKAAYKYVFHALYQSSKGAAHFPAAPILYLCGQSRFGSVITQNRTQIDSFRLVWYNRLGSFEPQGRQHSDGRFFSGILCKGGVPMPITLTFHIFGLTVTIRINGRNRHSGK